jgi:hypothetical protein
VTGPVKVAALAVTAFLAFRKKSNAPASPTVEVGDVRILPVEDEREDPTAPTVGEFWRWPSDPLPLIRTVGSEWGVYNPVRRTLMAVVNKHISEGEKYLVMSVSATANHPFNFPTANR